MAELVDDADGAVIHDTFHGLTVFSAVGVAALAKRIHQLGMLDEQTRSWLRNRFAIVTEIADRTNKLIPIALIDHIERELP